MTPDLKRLCEAADLAFGRVTGRRPYLEDNEAEAIVRAVLTEMRELSSAQIAAAWSAWKPRHKDRLGPGPAFREAHIAMIDHILKAEG